MQGPTISVPLFNQFPTKPCKTISYASPPAGWLQRIVRILPQRQQIPMPKLLNIPLIGSGMQLILEARGRTTKEIKATQHSPALRPQLSNLKAAMRHFAPHALQGNGRARQPTHMIRTPCVVAVRGDFLLDSVFYIAHSYM